MEEAIQSLTAQKIRELLTLCGIDDRSNELIKQYILSISNFGVKKKKNFTITTKIEDIQSYVDEITQMGYADAMHAVKKDNALFASKAMQAQYNKTVYWDIILKGAKLLDFAKLPTAMGRLDDFTRAEKHATRIFM